MAELLIELLSEEIPARMQARAAEDLKRLVCEGLKAAGLTWTRADSYVTPRRLALVVDGLPVSTPDRVEEIKGPRVGAPEQAIQGFLRKLGQGRTLDDCEKRSDGKSESWVFVQRIAGRSTSDLLHELIAINVAWAFPWPKAMTWSGHKLRWVRPLHSIVAVFDGSIVQGQVALFRVKVPSEFLQGGSVTDKSLSLPHEIQAEVTRAISTNSIRLGDETVGHRFLAPESFEVRSFAEYRDKLRAAFVILDPAERRVEIARQLAAVAAAAGLKAKDDPGLLDEVTGLVEWPVAHLGAIDPEFMTLPPEVLSTSMRAHQRYFTLLDAAGNMAPRFAVVANMRTDTTGSANIVAGNERVLRARLSDAKFFWDQDRKQKLADRVPALAQRMFYAKLGTMEDKVARLQALAADLAPLIRGCDPTKAQRAALLAKADLSTGMVGEFPELQGVMGRYYARADGEDDAVAEAIREHHAPQGPNDRCPSSPVSIAVALADKLDTLVGFFEIGEKPTGSKDPFALRRAALGVIRLLTENKLRIELVRILEPHFATVRSRIQQVSTRKKIQAANAIGVGAVVMSASLTAMSPWGTRGANVDRNVIDLLAFFADRLKVALREQGVRHDLIDAVFALGGEDDLVRLLARVEALKQFLAGDDGANLLIAYRRASNIVAIEEKKDKTRHDGAVDAAKFAQDEERALDAALTSASAVVDAALADQDFTAAMRALAALRQPVDSFFAKVTVNDSNSDLRANRLRLLSRIRATLARVADFSRIEGG